MSRRLIIGLTAITLSSWVDLSACGDKFLRVGRSGRFQRYAAVHASSILIYSPAASTRAGIDELKALLKRAGHKAVALERTASVPAALAAAPYDVVIADIRDADRLTADLRSASSRALLLPIVNQAPQPAAAAPGPYAFSIRPQAMTKFDALAEIDRLLDARSQTAAAVR
jgi:hypothetical protein